MKTAEDYRKRFYDTFDSTIWKQSHSGHIKEYELTTKVYRKLFRNILPEDREVKIIDISCGGGHFLYFLKQQGYKNVTGLDISKEMVKKCRSLGLTNILEGNLFTFLPKHKKQFDVIISNDTIEHLQKEEVLHFLELIRDALKPGGTALISTLNGWSFFACGNVYVDFTHEMLFTPESLLQVLRVCGFRNVRVYGYRPVVHDARSAVRVFCWHLLKRFLIFIRAIIQGTGRGVFKYKNILEQRIFAIAKKS